jgi:undecaprenyl-diphosphatase
MGYVQSGAGWLAGRGRDAGFDELTKVVAATIPVVVAGLLVKGEVEESWRQVSVIAGATILFGLVLAAADRFRGEATQITWTAALLIGLAQTLALVPGTSRSGITITAALFLGLSRTTAARFSFLLSIPTIAGAALLTGIDLATAPEPARWLDLFLGAALAGVSAYLCISAFIALVERTGMLPYVIYRLLLGAALFWVAA